MLRQIVNFVGGVLCLVIPALAQRAEILFDQNCAMCHEMGNTAQAPDRKALHGLTSEAVYQSLITGSMAERVPAMTDEQKRRLAEYIGGLKLNAADIADARQMTNHCAVNPPIASIAATPAWNGWGVDLANTRFQIRAGSGAHGRPGSAAEAEMVVRSSWCDDDAQPANGSGGSCVCRC